MTRDREELDVRVDALDRLRERIRTTPRRRSPVEAPLPQTNAYADYLLACGYARLLRADRARSLVAAARVALAEVAADCIHAYAIAACEARVEQAIANAPYVTPLPAALRRMHAALDRVSRYKVDRLREHSEIVESIIRPDAIGGFSRRALDSRGGELAGLAHLDSERHAHALATLLAQIEHSERVEPRLLAGILEHASVLLPEYAAPLVERALALVTAMPETERDELDALVLLVAEHAGRTDIVTAVIPVVASGRGLYHALRIQRRERKPDDAALIARAERILTPDIARRAVWAGGLACVDGERERALGVLDEIHVELSSHKTGLDARLRLIRALAYAYASAPVDVATRGIDRLTDQLVVTTDCHGTNSHYAISVLSVIDSLVCGLL